MMTEEIPAGLRVQLKSAIDECERVIDTINESMRLGNPPVDIEGTRIWLHRLRQAEAAIKRGDLTELRLILRTIFPERD